MFEQGFDALLELLRQCADQGLVMHLRGVAPFDVQLALVDQGGNVEQMGAAGIGGTHGRAQRLRQAPQARATQPLVDPPQVVEGQQRSGTQPMLGIEAQQAVADALLRYAAQGLLGGDDRLFRLPGSGHGQGVAAGVPAHRARQIRALLPATAAVALHLQGDLLASQPLADHASQGGDQQILHLGAVGPMAVAQQQFGFLDGQLGFQRAAFAIQADVTGDLALLGQLRLPVVALGQYLGGMAMLLQGRAPAMEARGNRRQLSLRVEVQAFQLFEQHLPGHRIDQQVMRRAQQVPAAGEIHPADQRRAIQLPALLPLLQQRVVQRLFDHLQQLAGHVRR
ncbi:hypothetical protein SRABI70_02626 [Pseudomonas sp. Bi70]|nr:hypothetical protein SRABI70_02626 [Pseudomonas sp. Bi70]